ncbi:MAG: DUF4446 family protein [Candidatus Nanopelagicales bacterium]
MPDAAAYLALVLASLALVLATLANRRWARRTADPGTKGEPRRSTPGPGAPDTALRHVAVVRYDAFGDVGGRLSYSVAILDDTGSGLILSTLSGKADVRTYVKTISGGQPDQALTPEEKQAVAAAVGSRQ